MKREEKLELFYHNREKLADKRKKKIDKILDKRQRQDYMLEQIMFEKQEEINARQAKQ